MTAQLNQGFQLRLLSLLGVASFAAHGVPLVGFGVMSGQDMESWWRVSDRRCGSSWVVAELCMEMCPQEKACWIGSSLPGEFCLAVMLRFICNGK